MFSNVFYWMKTLISNNMCSLGSNWQYIITGLDNGLALNRGQAIIWTNDSLVNWHIYASLGLNGITPKDRGKWIISQIAKFMGPTWSPPGSCRPQMGPMLAPWSLLSGMILNRTDKTTAKPRAANHVHLISFISNISNKSVCDFVLMICSDICWVNTS